MYKENLKLRDKLVKKHNICWKSARLGVITGCATTFLLCSAICLIMNIYSDDKKQKMVYVDVDKVIANVTEKILNISDPHKANAKLQEYRIIFDKALDSYSQEHNVIIFSSPKPIRGAEDKTNELIKRTFKEKESNDPKLNKPEEHNRLSDISRSITSHE